MRAGSGYAGRMLATGRTNIKKPEIEVIEAVTSVSKIVACQMWLLSHRAMNVALPRGALADLRQQRLLGGQYSRGRPS